MGSTRNIGSLSDVPEEQQDLPVAEIHSLYSTLRIPGQNSGPHSENIHLHTFYGTYLSIQAIIFYLVSRGNPQNNWMSPLDIDPHD
jgi:hypothetical protein